MAWRKAVATATFLISIVIAGFATPAATASPSISTSLPDIGFDVNFGDNPHTDAFEIHQAAAVFSYAAALGANAVALNFNFYLLGQTPTNAAQNSSDVVSGPGTPSPELLAVIIKMAEQQGLRVQLRPALSAEGFVFNQTDRSTIAPSDPSHWFRSYLSWLSPYLVVASSTAVSSVSLAVEMGSLVSASSVVNGSGTIILAAHNYLPYWLTLVQGARNYYNGDLLYSASHINHATISGVGFGFDAYTAVTLPSGAAIPTASTPDSTVVSDFIPSLTANYQRENESTLPETRVEEVGLPAVNGAWNIPTFYAYPSNTPMARWVQRDWITANCDVMMNLHLAGMFIWAIDLNTFSATFNADTANDYNNFEGTSTETSISSCFANVRAAAAA